MSCFSLRNTVTQFVVQLVVVAVAFYAFGEEGRKDVVVTETMARETAAEFPNSSLVFLETVGHSVMVEDPKLWKKTLVEFLSTIQK